MILKSLTTVALEARRANAADTQCPEARRTESQDRTGKIELEY